MRPNALIRSDTSAAKPASRAARRAIRHSRSRFAQWSRTTSRTAALRRRLIRLRSTAFPTFLLTVKPNLAPPAGPHSRHPAAWPPGRIAGVAKRAPLRIRKNSGRRFEGRKRERWEAAAAAPVLWPCTHPLPASSRQATCGPSRAGAQESCGRRPFACACGNHGAACERPCSADRYASRLVSVFKPGPEPLENTAARRLKTRTRARR